MQEIADEKRPVRARRARPRGRQGAPDGHRLRAEDPARGRDPRGRDHLLRLGGLHRHVRGAARARHRLAASTSSCSACRARYWRGDASGIGMQRIRGTAYFTADDLDAHLKRLEEAKKRDHRRSVRSSDLFSFHEESPGFAFFHKKGVILWNQVEGLVREELTERGYEEIKTPLILTDELWHRSGHYDHYRDNMYFVEKEDRSFAVKPMNCPGACLVYGTDHALLQGAPAPRRGVRARAPLRALRRAPRPLPRARLRAGRRARLLHPRPDRGRGHRLRRHARGRLSRPRLRPDRREALDPSGGPDGGRRDLGQGGGRPRRRPRTHGLEYVIAPGDGASTGRRSTST